MRYKEIASTNGGFKYFVRDLEQELYTHGIVNFFVSSITAAEDSLRITIETCFEDKEKALNKDEVSDYLERITSVLVDVLSIRCGVNKSLLVVEGKSDGHNGFDFVCSDKPVEQE